MYTFVNPIRDSVKDAFIDSIICESNIAVHDRWRGPEVDVVLVDVDHAASLLIPRCVIEVLLRIRIGNGL